MSSSLRQTLARLRNGLEWDGAGRVTIRAEALPTPEERQALGHRLRQLSDVLDRRGRKQLAVIVAELLQAYPRRIEEGEARSTIAAYVKVLDDLPPWAVAEAAGRFSRGVVVAHHNGFPPSAAELHVEATNLLRAWRDERAVITELLAAKPAKREIGEAERARVRAGFEDLQRSLAGDLAMHREEERQAAEARDAERGATLEPYRKAQPSPSLEPSEALLAKLKEPTA